MRVLIIFKDTIKKACRSIFVIYILFLIYIFFLYSTRNITYNNYNLIPFHTITNYIKYFDHFNFTYWFLNIFGNIIIFMPFGFLVPIIFSKIDSFIKILFLTIIVSLTVESMQYFSKVGEFDIDDVILNTIGSIIGFLICYIFSKKIAYLKK